MSGFYQEDVGYVICTLYFFWLLGGRGTKKNEENGVTLPRCPRDDSCMYCMSEVVRGCEEPGT